MLVVQLLVEQALLRCCFGGCTRAFPTTSADAGNQLTIARPCQYGHVLVRIAVCGCDALFQRKTACCEQHLTLQRQHLWLRDSRRHRIIQSWHTAAGTSTCLRVHCCADCCSRTRAGSRRSAAKRAQACPETAAASGRRLAAA